MARQRARADPVGLQLPLQARERFDGAAHRGGSLRLPRQGRRKALWGVLDRSECPTSLLVGDPEETPAFCALSAAEEITWDNLASGQSQRRHLMEQFRSSLSKQGLPVAADITRMENGQIVSYVGAAICRQMPGTAAGVLSMTMEDETGFANLVVWEKASRDIARSSRSTSSPSRSGSPMSRQANRGSPLPTTISGSALTREHEPPREKTRTARFWTGSGRGRSRVGLRLLLESIRDMKGDRDPVAANITHMSRMARSHSYGNSPDRLQLLMRQSTGALTREIRGVPPGRSGLGRLVRRRVSSVPRPARPVMPSRLVASPWSLRDSGAAEYGEYRNP